MMHSGQSALHNAAFCGDQLSTEALMKAGADVKQLDKSDN
jgi:hypothetical protein